MGRTSTPDLGISAWSTCPSSGTQIVCEDLAFGATTVETISFPVTTGQTVHLMVDGFGDASQGPFTLQVATVAAATCGDGFTDGAEACDDGNAVNGDGCDTNCTVSACGNGLTGGTEQCDDGNTTNGDGCDNNCTTSACGNGICAGTETSCSCIADCDANPTQCDAGECGTFCAAKTCQCDDACVTFGDCCADAVAECSICATTAAAYTESEPNDDGTPAIGNGLGTALGNDFLATAADGYSCGDVTISGAINPAGDEDIYAVTNDTAAPANVTFATGIPTIGSCTGGDTRIFIRNAAGTELASNDDFNGTLCSQLTYTVPANTTVFVHIIEYGDNNTIAAYQLSVNHP